MGLTISDRLWRSLTATEDDICDASLLQELVSLPSDPTRGKIEQQCSVVVLLKYMVCIFTANSQLLGKDSNQPETNRRTPATHMYSGRQKHIKGYPVFEDWWWSASIQTGK